MELLKTTLYLLIAIILFIATVVVKYKLNKKDFH